MLSIIFFLFLFIVQTVYVYSHGMKMTNTTSSKGMISESGKMTTNSSLSKGMMKTASTKPIPQKMGMMEHRSLQEDPHQSYGRYNKNHTVYEIHLTL